MYLCVQVQLNLKNAELSAKSLSSDNNLLTKEIVELRAACDASKKKLREEVHVLKMHTYEATVDYY